VDPINKLLELMQQFYNIVGPAFITIGVLLYAAGSFIFNTYKFNIESEIENAFPSQFIFYFFFFWVVITATVILIVTILQSLQLNKGKNSTNHNKNLSA
jgi:heme/copper-type cytochrome/quinol oxidase subunit 2